MIYGYARVSTAGQQKDGNSLEDQENSLREHGAVKIYRDAFTGMKLERPQFQELLSVVKAGDTIIATKLDRVSRSASQGIMLVDSLLERGVRLHILNMGVMDNSSTGRLIRNIMFSFAEFERDMIVERTNEGKAVARQKEGYKEGRKKKEIDAGLFEKYRDECRLGRASVEECCKKLGISRSTWYNRIREAG